MIVGDTHGNAGWLRRYIYPVAKTIRADAIVQLGDFGAWEHTDAGVLFMDSVNDLSQATGIPLYWVRGNHDKTSHTLATYQPDERGFYVCREFVFHIPDGLAWQWGGVNFRAYGGAYSIDKGWRIEAEQERYLRLMRQAQFARKHVTVEPQDGTLWFPEEEMTDSVMGDLLAADAGPVDVILSHDKPYSSEPGWNRKDLPGCIPNQLRLELALRQLQPQWWLHGHLHYYYQHTLHGPGFKTTVIGLDPDDNAAEQNWKMTQSWVVLDCMGGKTTLKTGFETFLDTEVMQHNMAALG